MINISWIDWWISPDKCGCQGAVWQRMNNLLIPQCPVLGIALKANNLRLAIAAPWLSSPESRIVARCITSLSRKTIRLRPIRVLQNHSQQPITTSSLCAVRTGRSSVMPSCILIVAKPLYYEQGVAIKQKWFLFFVFFEQLHFKYYYGITSKILFCYCTTSPHPLPLRPSK